MTFQLNKRALAGALVVPLFFLALLDLTVASIFTAEWNLSRSLNVVDPVVAKMKEPMQTISEAWVLSFFRKLQWVVLLLYGVLGVKMYRRFRGKKYEEAHSYGSHGSSRFAKKEEVMNGKFFAKKTWASRNPEKNLQNPSGLIFGILKNKPLILPEDTKVPNRNVFVIGPPGSHKTQGYVLTNIIHERNRSIVVPDLKGELFEKTARLKQKQGYEVRMINFKNMEISDRFNPLQYIEKEVDAEKIATAIVINSQQENKADFG